MIQPNGLLVLETKDLTIEGRRKRIEDVSMYDIAYSIEPFNHASTVIVYHQGKRKLLKSRYRMRNIEGNLITLAKDGMFDVITHGCNCFCTMGAGIAVPMKQNFGCDNFPMEAPEYRGDINKLGTIDYREWGMVVDGKGHQLIIVNSYTQYMYGKNHVDGVSSPVDYDAIRMCMRKINHTFPGKSIGLPLIGAGLAGGDWNIIEEIIQTELLDMDVTIVYFEK